MAEAATKAERAMAQTRAVFMVVVVVVGWT